jgi:hypothetical protein
VAAVSAHLIVTYACSNCFEDAESDGDFGLICRRCCIRYNGYADGDPGEEMTRADFVDNYGDRKPQPTSAELLAALVPSMRRKS